MGQARKVVQRRGSRAPKEGRAERRARLGVEIDQTDAHVGYGVADRLQQVDGFRLARPPAHPVPIYVAALRTGIVTYHRGGEEKKLAVADGFVEGLAYDVLMRHEDGTASRLGRFTAQGGAEPQDVGVMAMEPPADQPE